MTGSNGRQTRVPDDPDVVVLGAVPKDLPRVAPPGTGVPRSSNPSQLPLKFPALNVSNAHSVRTIFPLESKIPALVRPPWLSCVEKLFCASSETAKHVTQRKNTANRRNERGGTSILPRGGSEFATCGIVGEAHCQYNSSLDLADWSAFEDFVNHGTLLARGDRPEFHRSRGLRRPCVILTRPTKLWKSSVTNKLFSCMNGH